MNGHTGEFSALITALLWTVTALAFEQAAKRVGSLAVNIIRLALALVFYSILSLVRYGQVLPSDTSLHGWIWLSISGLVGFVFGDYCLFSAYALIGSRISNLLMALAPPLATFFGWLLADDLITFKGLLGMMVTLSGITLVILRKPGGKINLHYSAKGILFGVGGAVGQAMGLVFSKIGMQQSDPFSSSQIRVIAGTIGFIILITVLGKWHKVRPAVNTPKNLGFISLGSFFGPFLGVSLSLMSIKYTSTGIASTIMALTPVLLIPPAALLLKEKITWRDLAGSLIAVGGVALFFL